MVDVLDTFKLQADESLVAASESGFNHSTLSLCFRFLCCILDLRGVIALAVVVVSTSCYDSGNSSVEDCV
jgi:hypothetical protein